LVALSRIKKERLETFSGRREIDVNTTTIIVIVLVAAAIVAGCAALVKSKSPSGTGGAEIKEKLKKAAEEKPDIGPPPNIRLNCAQAVP